MDMSFEKGHNMTNMKNMAMEHDIIEGMDGGVVMVNEVGKILYMNPAAESIFERKKEDILGQSLCTCFFEYEENDEFNQLILDAIYEKNVLKDQFVNYYTGEKTKVLHVKTSFRTQENERLGMIILFSDVSELYELRDAVVAMKRIEKLNVKLNLRNELLSKTFGRYLSDEIVKQLMDTEDGLALGGKKEHLTIIMSDLRGFTAMSESMTANDLLAMLNHYLGEMTEIIQKYKGTIIEFIGDGIMALFGAPQPLKNHAEQAVAAAIEMQMQMDKINRWNVEQGYPELQMGIGINTGDMIVGNIGSEKRTKYGVTGSEVNLCGRVESYTIGGQVLISEKTRQEIHVELDLAGSFQVYPKGSQKPLTIYHVEGIRAPYMLSIQSEPDEMYNLVKTLPITFSMVIGKEISEKKIPGELLALGEKGALIRVDTQLCQYDNVVLHVGGALYAKVMEVKEYVARLHFTAYSKGFDSFYKNVIDGDFQ